MMSPNESRFLTAVVSTLKESMPMPEMTEEQIAREESGDDYDGDLPPWLPWTLADKSAELEGRNPDGVKPIMDDLIAGLSPEDKSAFVAAAQKVRRDPGHKAWMENLQAEFASQPWWNQTA
jgi:hypothetical protein